MAQATEIFPSFGPNLILTKNNEILNMWPWNWISIISAGV